MKFLSTIALILSCISLPLSARILSVNFEGGTTSSGDELAAADSAGVFSIAHWNNINVGTLNASHAVNVPSTPLKDDTGVATTGTIAINLASAYIGSSGSGSSTSNHKMMSSYVSRKASDSGNITIANLPTPYTAGYSVYVYFDADTNDRTFDITVNGTTIQAKDATTFNGTYKNAATTPLDANYVVFTGLTASSFSIIMDSDSGRAALNGIQIVSDDHPVPPTIQSFTVNDYYVSPGSPVTFSWETDGATTISIDQSVGDVTSLSSNGDGNTNSNVASTTTYTLTATNVAGTDTKTLRVGAGAAKPNILFFLVDDMGWQDTTVPLHYDSNGNPILGTYNTRYRTPNMEALAAKGRKFTNAYAYSICSPTRVSIMTGMHAARHHVTTWTHPQTPQETGGNNIPHLAPPTDWRKAGMNSTDVALPKLLQDTGYRTIHAGKAHFGPNSEPSGDPTFIGFDVNIGGHGGGGPGSYLGSQNFSGAWRGAPSHWDVPGLDEYHIGNYGSEVFLTEALTLEMNKSIEQSVNDGVPFFAYMSHYAVHVPWTTDHRFSANYDGNPASEPNLSGQELTYATIIEGMDKSLGDIMAKLETLGVAKDTIVIFYSDNGSDLRDGGEESVLRGYKGTKWESAYRVPFIVSWAQLDGTNSFQQNMPIPVNSREDDIINAEDMFTTVASIAGANYSHTVDGFDLRPYFTGTTGTHRPQQFIQHFPHGHGSDHFAVLRKDDWKIIHEYSNGSTRLYNIVTDIGETTDVAAANPEVVMAMTRHLAKELDRYGAQYSVNTNTSQPTPPVMPNLPAVDLDNDGVPDLTEDTNSNGIVDPGETNPENDNTDGDNVKDGSEIKIGTDPLDATSFFKLEQSFLSNGDLQIAWPSAPGSSFILRSSTDLNNWAVVASSIPASTGSTTIYNAGQPGGTSFFYHLELE